jgi:quercetin dioxygenase-like cupin family protein
MTANGDVIIENDRFKVTRWRFLGGDSTGMHEHEHDYVVVPVTGGRFEVTLPDGTIQSMAQTPGNPYARSAGVRHDVHFVGEDEAVFLEIESQEKA